MFLRYESRRGLSQNICSHGSVNRAVTAHAVPPSGGLADWQYVIADRWVKGGCLQRSGSVRIRLDAMKTRPAEAQPRQVGMSIPCVKPNGRCIGLDAMKASPEKRSVLGCT